MRLVMAHIKSHLSDKFPLPSEEEETLMSFFSCRVYVIELNQIIGDIFARELEALSHLCFSIIDADWSVYSTLFLKSMIHYFILLTLRERVLF